MRETARRHQLTVFLAVTFGFSWGLWILMIASQRGLLPFVVPTHWSGSFGPALGALAAIALGDGWSGVKALLRRLVQWRAGLGIWAFAIGATVLAEAIALGLWAAVEGQAPVLAVPPDLAVLPGYFLLILVIGGPLGEEPGWRGFLQPHLQRRFSPAVAALIVGVVWSLWHAPLPWLAGAAQEDTSPLSFALLVIPNAFIFAWVLNRSSSGLLTALILHTSTNTFSYVVEPGLAPAMADDATFTTCFTVAVWLIAVVVVVADRRRFLAKPVQKTPGPPLRPSDAQVPP